MQLFIRHNNNKTYVIKCEPNITYKNLKNLIINKINDGISYNKFQLIYQSNFLENKYGENKLLNEMNISDESQIQIRDIFFKQIK